MCYRARNMETIMYVMNFAQISSNRSMNMLVLHCVMEISGSIILTFPQSFARNFPPLLYFTSWKRKACKVVDIALCCMLSVFYPFGSCPLIAMKAVGRRHRVGEKPTYNTR